MQHLKTSYTLLAAIALAASVPAYARDLTTVKSPDGKLSLTVMDDNGTVSYRLAQGAKILVNNSNVGITTSIADFSSGLSVKAVNDKEISTSFTLPAASDSKIDDNCKEVIINVEKDSQTASFIFRLYNEGLAWHYVVNGSGNVNVTGETGECNIASQDELLNLPLSQGTRASFTDADTDLLECMKTAALPLMIKSGDNYLLVGETAPVKDYCGSRLTVAGNGSYVFTPVETISASLPLSTPWRTIMAGDLATIAASHMADCIAEPAAHSDMSWIKPGRAASSYSGEDHGATYLDRSVINSYIDWAASQGWEYFTIDKTWNLSTSDLKEISTYAKSKNIGIFVWKNRASLPTTEGSLRAALQSVKTSGAVGIKVEFWENESQTTVNQRNMLMRIAAEQHLMVLLANSVNTAGLSRTWPHLMGTEAGLTNSSYVFMPGSVNAVHNINAAILRAAAGPVDYYPVDFAEQNGKLLQATTHAHQLALAVAFHSGIQHIADAPGNIRYGIAKDILKSLPAKWDETLWLDARHNEYLSVMRRSGNDRYVAALSAEALTAEIPLSFLSDGETVNAYIFRDGSCPTDIAFEYKTGLTSSSTLTIPIAGNGGVLVRLTADDGSAKPFCNKYEAESPANGIPFGVSVLTDPDRLCAGDAYVAGAGKGRPLTFNGINVPSPGTYAVTVYYMASEASSGSARLNGSLASIRGLNFINSGGTTGRSLAQTTVNMQFDTTENNSLEISSTDMLPAIDRITVTDNTTTKYTDGIESVSADTDTPCKVYARERNVVIETADKVSYMIYNVLGMRIAAGTAEAGTTVIPLDENGVAIVSVTAPSGTFSQKILIK